MKELAQQEKKATCNKCLTDLDIKQCECSCHFPKQPEKKECKHIFRTLKNINGVTEEITYDKRCMLCGFKTNVVSPTQDWDIGSLTFDRLKNILEICNVKDVETWSEGITVSFVPKNVTGKAWKDLKENLHQITNE